MASLFRSSLSASRRFLITNSIPARLPVTTTVSVRALSNTPRRFQGEPGRTNVTPPSPKPSDSAEENDIKSNRAMEGKNSPDSASLAKPATPGGAQGQDEEGGDPIKQSPSKPNEEKAKTTEKEGNKPLDAADK